MLNKITRSVRPTKSRQRGRKQWHDAKLNVPSLGCSICPDYQTCGGLFVSEPLFWCLDHCCGNPDKCDTVCRNNPSYVEQLREIGGFGFDNIPEAKPCSIPALPTVLPMFFHSSGRRLASRATAVALPFTRMFDRRTGEPKYSSRIALCEAFKVREDASIILSGVDKDAPIEAWWALGRNVRRNIAANLRNLRIGLVTSPNYSLFTDQPRWDNLHSMKRIAIVQSELMGFGIQTALHVNGRTDKDFERWGHYLSQNQEIQFISYEFTTGPGWVGRRDIHLQWLTDLAKKVERPLHIIVRGGVELLPALADAFANVTFVDTAAFMKTMKRRRAVVMESGRLVWRAAPTRADESLDNLLSSNIAGVTTWTLDHLNSHRPVRLSA